MTLFGKEYCLLFLYSFTHCVPRAQFQYAETTSSTVPINVWIVLK